MNTRSMCAPAQRKLGQLQQVKDFMWFIRRVCPFQQLPPNVINLSGAWPLSDPRETTNGRSRLRANGTLNQKINTQPYLYKTLSVWFRLQDAARG